MNTKNNRLTLNELKNELDVVTSFGDALKSERQARDMSRREFSEFLGISIQSLADLEHGRRIPSPERAFKIAEQIGEIPAYWVELSINDQLKEKYIDLKVRVS